MEEARLMHQNTNLKKGEASLVNLNTLNIILVFIYKLYYLPANSLPHIVLPSLQPASI